MKGAGETAIYETNAFLCLREVGADWCCAVSHLKIIIIFLSGPYVQGTKEIRK